MDRARFFAALRKRGSGVFGTKLTPGQVAGTEAILDSCVRNDVSDRQHVANVLANVRRETGGRMAPVRETFADSDAQAISRLERAWKAGKLKWVKTPYWRDGAFGRGPLQLTHWAAYEKFGLRLGLPLRQKPELALDPKIGADIAVIGMKEGLFTGRKLADYKFPAALDAKPKNNPRRIVNGQDGSDAEVAGFHRAFLAALDAGGYAADPKAEPADDLPVTDRVTVEVVQRRLLELGYTEVGGIDGKVGSMTMAAILLFREDNGLPLVPVIDKRMIAALEHARPRKVSPKREQATPDQVREKVPEAQSSWLNKIIGQVLAVPALLVALATGVLERLGMAKETLEPFREFAADIPGWVWFGAVGGIALVIYLNARKGEAKSIEAFKSGARR